MSAQPKAADAEAAPRRSLRQRQKDFTYDQIISSAMTVFGRVGFSATTMDSIADEAQVSRGTLYAHFPNKSEILKAAIARLRNERIIFGDLAEADTFDKLVKVFDSAIRYWAERSNGTWRHVVDAATVEPSIREWKQEYLRMHRKIMVEVLRQRGVGAEEAASRAHLLVTSYSAMAYEIADDPEISSLPFLSETLAASFMAMADGTLGASRGK